MPAEAAALPNVVDESSLVPANSLFVFTIYGSFILGYSLAAPVIKLAGHYGVYITAFMAYLVATIFSSFLPPLRARDETHANYLTLAFNVMITVRREIKHIIKERRLFFPILQLTVAQAIVSIIIVLAPALSLKLLGVELSDSAHILIIPAGIGMVAGAILVGQFLKNTDKIKAINVGLVSAGAGLILLGLSDRIFHASIINPVVALIVLFLGMINALVTVSAQTLLQINSSDQTRGQIFGALNMMINIASTLPVLLAGLTADIISPTAVVVALGGFILGFSILQMWLSRTLAIKSVDIPTPNQ